MELVLDFEYEIPLLCPYLVFVHALTALRAKQRGEQLDATACNNRYHKKLNTETCKLFRFATETHTLRAVYAAFVHHLYACDVTFNRMAMLVLGHEELTVSLSYNAVVLHDVCPAGCLGPLP